MWLGRMALLAALILAPASASAKVKCSKVVGHRVDAIDGTELHTVGVVYSSFVGMGMTHNSNPSDILPRWSTALELRTSGVTNLTIPAGAELLIVLRDGTKLSLISRAEATPKSDTRTTRYDTEVYTTWSTYYTSSEEDFRAIARSNIAAMQVRDGAKRYLDVTVDHLSKKYQKKVATLTEKSACLLDALGADR